MASGARISIEGIQEAQAANLRIVAAMRPAGAAGRAVQLATLYLHRFAVANTHVDSGALRASHRADVRGLRGEIYIDPGAVNPDGQRPAVYGPYEHARGGEHAFYDRAVAEGGDGAVRIIEDTITAEAGL